MAVVKSLSEYEEEEEARIIQQMESTRVMKTGASHLFSEYLGSVDRGKPFYKVFGNIYCGFNSDSAHNEALE